MLSLIVSVSSEFSVQGSGFTRRLCRGGFTDQPHVALSAGSCAIQPQQVAVHPLSIYTRIFKSVYVLRFHRTVPVYASRGPGVLET